MADSASNKHSILEQFSQQAEGYSRLIGGMADERGQFAFRDLVDARTDDHVLDVCCGPGTLALRLAPFVSHVTGLDLTPAMLEQARAAQERKGVANADWVEGDVFALPFTRDAFSLVTCGTAFHHLPDPLAAMNEMVRVCRPGGRIVVVDMTPDAAKSVAFDRMEKLRDPSHVHALSPAEMAGLGEDMEVGAAQLCSSFTADLPLDAILETSFPETCTIEDIRSMFLEDARSGEDRLGFNARLVDGEVQVSYVMSTAIWTKK